MSCEIIKRIEHEIEKDKILEYQRKLIKALKEEVLVMQEHIDKMHKELMEYKDY